jgi:cytidylate kinase
MMSEIFKENYPIIIGLAGKAGSGKTSVAETICPKGSVISSGDLFQNNRVIWQHLFYALPLYELASIKKNIKGINEKSRKMYAIHEVLFDIYGGSPIGFVPPYEKLVQMVLEIESMAIEPEEIKPRNFLQKAGDICRSHRYSCFSDWVIMKSIKLYKQYRNSLEENDSVDPFAVIVSDVRFENEADGILKQPNGMVIVFDAEDAVLNQRIIKRDGKPLSEEQINHHSEKQIDTIRQKATHVLKTDDMSVEEQAFSTLKLITNRLETVGV